MTALTTRVAEHVARAGLFRAPGLALLAVSGGPDSLALLDLFATTPPPGCSLLVAHADHGIHPDSGRVADEVARVARERYGIETVIGRLGLGAEASETAARDARYAFLRAVQDDRGAAFLVTAHHADDQVETVLLRLLRGSGPAGLAGIAPLGPRGLVRPLLPFRHRELLEQVRAAGLAPFDDPANADPRHTRSWLRAAVLPVLRARMGAEADAALLGVASHARDDVAAWDLLLDTLPALDLRVTEGRIDVARPGLQGYDSLLAGRLLRAAAHRAGLRLGPAQALRVAELARVAASGRTLDLGDGVTAEASFDRVVLARARPGTGGPQRLEGAQGREELGGVSIAWRTEPAPARLPREGWTTWIAPGALALALPDPGARLVPLGGTGRRTVAKLLMEERLPRLDRGAWPVVLRDGEPVWIPGVCRAAAAIPEPGTLCVRMDAAAR